MLPCTTRPWILVPALALVAAPLLAGGPAATATSPADASIAVAPVVIVATPPLRPNTPPYKIQGSAFAVHEQGIFATCACVVETIGARHFFPRSSVGVLLPSTAARSLALKGKKPEDLTYLDGVEFVPVKVVDLDRDRDLALLQIADGPHRVTPLGRETSPVAAGTEVLVPCVSPSSFHPRLSRGIVGGVVGGLEAAPGTTIEVYTTSMVCPTGAMGAPALDPRTGRVLAVTKAHVRLLGRPLSPVAGLTPDDYCVPVFLPIRYVGEALARVLGK